MIKYFLITLVFLFAQEINEKPFKNIDLLQNDQYVLQVDKNIDNLKINFYYDSNKNIVFLNNSNKKMMLIKSGGHSLYGKSYIIYLKEIDLIEFEIIEKSILKNLNSEQVSLTNFIENHFYNSINDI
jgi:hypothetical protein